MDKKAQRQKEGKYNLDKYWERRGCKYFCVCSQQLADPWRARHSLTHLLCTSLRVYKVHNAQKMQNRINVQAKCTPRDAK